MKSGVINMTKLGDEGRTWTPGKIACRGIGMPEISKEAKYGLTEGSFSVSCPPIIPHSEIGTVIQKVGAISDIKETLSAGYNG